MKLYSPQLEQKAVVSILDCGDRIRNKLLATLKPEWFGFEPAREVFEHTMTFIKEGQSIPSVRIMAHDTGISKRARSFLRKGSQDKSKHPSRFKEIREVSRAISLLSKYRKQRISDSMGHLIVDEMEKDNPDHDEMFSNIESLMLQARRGQDQGIVHIGSGDNFDDDLDELLSDEAVELIPTGWKPFDANTGGFGRTDLIFLAANYGGGKTAASIDLAARVYKKGYSVLIVSLEMPRRQVWQRLWANQADIDYEIFRMHKHTEEQKEKVKRARQKWKAHGKRNKIRFSVWSPGKINPWQLVNEVKAYEYDLILVDYVNLLEPLSKSDERVALGEIARALKIGAGESYLNCAMVVLAQLNDDNRIKYSRAMAEHADFILWWRMGEEEKATGFFEVHQDKARNARQYSMKFKSEFSKMRVEALHEVGENQSIGKKKDQEDPLRKKKETKRVGMSGLLSLGG